MLSKEEILATGGMKRMCAEEPQMTHAVLTYSLLPVMVLVPEPHDAAPTTFGESKRGAPVIPPCLLHQLLTMMDQFT